MTGLRPLKELDKDLIYHWRNSEPIRMNMYNNRLIPYDDHCRWFENVLYNHSKYYRLFSYGDKPLGLISFKECTQQICFWGFYIGDSLAPKGFGTIMGSMALDYAFYVLEMEKIIGDVLSFNKKSEKLHHKLGFTVDRQYKKQFKRDGEMTAVIRFGLCKEEWEVQKRKLNM